MRSREEIVAEIARLGHLRDQLLASELPYNSGQRAALTWALGEPDGEGEKE